MTRRRAHFISFLLAGALLLSLVGVAIVWNSSASTTRHRVLRRATTHHTFPLPFPSSATVAHANAPGRADSSGTVTIVGRCESSAEHALPETTVALLERQHGLWRPTAMSDTTSEDGSFELHMPVSSAPLLLAFVAPGFAPHDILIPRADAPTLDVGTIVLHPGISTRLVLLDAHGRPLPATPFLWWVTEFPDALLGTLPAPARATTDHAGETALSNLPWGHLHAFISTPGHFTALPSVPIHDIQREDPMVLRQPHATTWTIHVHTDADVPPDISFAVELGTSAPNMPVEPVRLSADSFRLDVAADIRLALRISAPNFLIAHAYLYPGEPNPVHVTLLSASDVLCIQPRPSMPEALWLVGITEGSEIPPLHEVRADATGLVSYRRHGTESPLGKRIVLVNGDRTLQGTSVVLEQRDIRLGACIVVPLEQMGTLQVLCLDARTSIPVPGADVRVLRDHTGRYRHSVFDRVEYDTHSGERVLGDEPLALGKTGPDGSVRFALLPGRPTIVEAACRGYASTRRTVRADHGTHEILLEPGCGIDVRLARPADAAALRAVSPKTPAIMLRPHVTDTGASFEDLEEGTWIVGHAAQLEWLRDLYHAPDFKDVAGSIDGVAVCSVRPGTRAVVRLPRLAFDSLVSGCVDYPFPNAKLAIDIVPVCFSSRRLAQHSWPVSPAGTFLAGPLGPGRYTLRVYVTATRVELARHDFAASPGSVEVLNIFPLGYRAVLALGECENWRSIHVTGQAADFRCYVPVGSCNATIDFPGPGLYQVTLQEYVREQLLDRTTQVIRVDEGTINVDLGD